MEKDNNKKRIVMIIRMTIYVNVDDDIYGNSEEEKKWMEEEIFAGNGNLFLHSNEIGDTVGEILKVCDIQWLSKTDGC